MFPPVHLGVAYLLYAGGERVLGRAAPAGAATLALVVGAAIPDLVDQSLYRLVALPSTRTLAHSLLVAVPASALVALAVRRAADAPEGVGTGFAVGWATHPLADALWPALLGPREEVGFLLWPVLHSPDYRGTKPVVALGEVTVTTTWVELPLLALALALWWRDGRPGLGALRRRVQPASE